jgi:TP901 family phage tail tape measure protein
VAGQSYPVEILLQARDQASAVLKNVGTAAQQGLGKLGGLAGTITPEMGRLGAQATVAGGAIVGALGLAGNASAQYGRQIAEVGTLSGEARDMLGEYRTELLSLSAEYGQSTEALTKGLYDSVSAGIAAGDAIQFMADASKMAVGGVTDVSTSVDLLTSVLNAYGAEASEAAHYSDVMFATVQKGKTTIPELAANMGKIASTAAMAGIPIEEVGAALATMTAKGLRTEIATTSLAATIAVLMKPTKELSAALSSAGYASGEALLKAEGLTGAMKFLSEASGGSAAELSVLLGSIESVRGASALTSDGAVGLAANLEYMGDSAGAASGAFGNLAGTSAFSMQQAAASTKAAIISIGAAMEGHMARLAAVTGWVSRMVAEHQTLAWVIGTLGGIVGGALLTFGLLIKTLQFVQAATVAVATVKTWLATVVGTATAATAAETTAVAANAAATQGAAAAAAANTVATEGMAAATVAAGATMTTVLLSVMAVLVALGIAIVSVKRTWEEFQRYRQAKKEAEFSLTSEKEMEAKREFQLSYKAEHGTTTGWMEAWEKTAEAQRLRQETEAASSKAWGSSGEAGDMASTLQALQQQAEQTQKSLQAMTFNPEAAKPIADALPSAVSGMGATIDLPPGTQLDCGGQILTSIMHSAQTVAEVVSRGGGSMAASGGSGSWSQGGSMAASGGSGSWSQGGSSGSGPSGYATESDIQREYQTLLEMGDYAHLSAQELRAAAEYNAATVAQFEWIKAQGINQSTAWESAIHNAGVLQAEGRFGSVPVSSQTPSQYQQQEGRLSIGLDWGLVATQMAEKTATANWQIAVAPAY